MGLCAAALVAGVCARWSWMGARLMLRAACGLEYASCVCTGLCTGVQGLSVGLGMRCRRGAQP